MNRFFATTRDLLGALEIAERKRRLRFVRTGFHQAKQLHVFKSASECLDGASLRPRDKYLVISADAELSPRPVRIRNGDVRLVIDEQSCAGALEMCPGGFVEDDVLLAGSLRPIDPVRSLLFAASVRAGFEEWPQVHGFALGAEAETLFDQGLRLRREVMLPPDMDLRAPIPGSDGQDLQAS